MFTKKFWNYSGERSLKTFAQTVIALLGTGSLGIVELGWVSILSVSASAAFVSLMTSMVALSSDTSAAK